MKLLVIDLQLKITDENYKKFFKINNFFVGTKLKISIYFNQFFNVVLTPTLQQSDFG